MKSGFRRLLITAVFSLSLIAVSAAEPAQVFSFFQLESYDESDAGVLIDAVYEGARISVRSFDAVDLQQLQLLEKYIIDALFTEPSEKGPAVKIASVEILLNSRGSVANVELDELLVSVNDILAVRAGELFQNSFTISFGGGDSLPETVFPGMLYDCGLFREEGQEMLLQTGFLGWAEMAKQIREWIRTGYEEHDEDVLTFVYNNRVLAEADSEKKWDEILVLPPVHEPEWVSGLQIELGGANLFKYFGGETSVGFGSFTLDAVYTMQPERVPDQSNFRVFDAGYSAGLFLEIDPVLERKDGPLDVLGFGLCGAGNVFLYMPGLDESMIKKDVFAVGAELLLRLNIIPFIDGSDFLNDNDFLFHLSPRLVLKLPFSSGLSLDFTAGAPSLRFAAGGEEGFSLLTMGVDIGLRARYSFDRRLLLPGSPGESGE